MPVMRTLLASFLLATCALGHTSTCLDKRNGCNHDNCLRAVIASSAKPGTESASKDCVSFFKTTVTPVPVTTISTLFITSSFSTSTSTSTVYLSETQSLTASTPVTSVSTYILHEVDTLTSLRTSIETDTLTTTITSIYTRYGKKKREPYRSAFFDESANGLEGSPEKRQMTTPRPLSATTTTTTPTTTKPISTTAPVTSPSSSGSTAPASPIVAIPSQIPTYASACSGTVRYSSACSCIGISHVTTTLPTKTVTKTVTSGVSVTPRASTIITKTVSFTSVTTNPYTVLASTLVTQISSTTLHETITVTTILTAYVSTVSTTRVTTTTTTTTTTSQPSYQTCQATGDVGTVCADRSECFYAVVSCYIYPSADACFAAYPNKTVEFNGSQGSGSGKCVVYDDKSCCQQPGQKIRRSAATELDRSIGELGERIVRRG